MAKLQDGTRIYGTANVDGNLNVNTSLSVGTSLAVNTYFTANASQVKIGSPLSSNGSTGTAGQILVSGGANNAYWGSTTPLYNYSAQFNGSSYLSAPSNAAFTFGTGDFTVEAWVYTTAISSSVQQMVVNVGGSGGFAFTLFSDRIHVAQAGVADLTDFATTFVNNTWYHVALVRSSGSLKAYVNGVQQGSSYTNSTSYTGSGITVVGAQYEASLKFSGYISNVRIVKGVAVYTGAFTVPSSPLQTSQGAGTNIAAVSSSQVSLLTCNALTLTDASPNAFAITNNGPVVASATTYPTSFPQSAVYVPTTALTSIRQQFTGDGTTTQFNISGGYTPNSISVFVNGVLARNGSDVTVTSGSFITFTGITPPNGSLIDVTGTVPTSYSAITPVGYSVGALNGSSQYLTVGAISDFKFLHDNTTDWTVEAWVNPSSIALGDTTVISTAITSSNIGASIALNGYVGGDIYVYLGRGAAGYATAYGTTTAVLTANIWHHIAVTFTSSTKTFTIYVNGVSRTLTTRSTETSSSFAYSSSNPSYVLAVGRYQAATPGGYFSGYISNLRIAKTNVYINNFTVPQSPLQATQIYGGPTIQAITGTQTSLLTCNAPTIVDGSTNAFTITNNGAATVSTAIVPTFTNIVMNSTSADAYNSSTGNLGMLFNNTTNRQLFNAFGFQFKDDGGIITPTNKTKVSFYGSAADTWTVPAGVTRIFVKMWGAGGGGGSYGGWRQGSLGGAGGFTHGMFNVVPGEVVQVRPGGVGTDRPGAGTAYPDGGGASTGGGDNQYASNGGGSSSIRIPSISATVYAMYAGGGGGGGACNGFAVNSGGAGGGLIGQCGTRSGNYTTTQYGKGGTQSAGGAAGTGSNTTGGAGSAGQGGTHQNTNCYGGGGGGGYYGGGSGCFGSDNSMGGGGGGSGFVHSSALFGATYTGSYRTPPFSGDPDLMANPSLQNAYGGDESGQGGPGVVVFYY